ncbi:MAG: potassium transporter [Candidatus Delongbacteria bacterium]|nr:potassium transporter [Candidatus Delongbacteria bacterium]
MIRFTSPNQLLIFYYLLSILTGALLLSTGWASTAEPLSFIDSLFTATSAQCVTGLIVVDTGTRFTLFGQIVILALIQIGGLGIMTFSIYLFVYLKRNISFRSRMIIQDTLMHTPISDWQNLTGKVIKMTIFFEGLGAILLSFYFVPRFGFLKGVYHSVFHSISAFCNAGFSTFSDSFIHFRGSIYLNFVIMFLIFFGGIGFLVINEIHEYFISRRKNMFRISLHTKIVFVTTFILIITGFVIFWSLENGNSMALFSIKEKFLSSIFQSVTARTAGFNTVDISGLRSSTNLMMIFLMFIGGSPGSAAGGIKTTTLAIFFIIIRNGIKGSPNANIFNRTLSKEIIMKAFTITALAFSFTFIAVFFLLMAQSPVLVQEGNREFLSYFFEAVSAIGTVGLSMGVTSSLTFLGKIIIALLMFTGRVGILTLAFSVIKREDKNSTRYAEENIMVG